MPPKVVQVPVERIPNQGSPPSVEQLEQLANWMDAVFEVPGLRVRFGMDALLGLIPWLGDTVSSVVSLYILQMAHRYGVSRVTLARMALNVAVDYVFGSVPFLGDAFDVYWKSNRRNVELLRQHASSIPVDRRHSRSGDRLFLIGLLAALIALLVGSITLSWWLIALIYKTLFHGAG